MILSTRGRSPRRSLGHVESRELAVRTIRYVAIACSVAIGLGLVAVAAAAGDCSMAGGSCPADPEPLLDDDTFRLAATGTFLAVAVPVLAWRPSRRRLGIALGVGIVAALVIGLIIRSGADA